MSEQTLRCKPIIQAAPRLRRQCTIPPVTVHHLCGQDAPFPPAYSGSGVNSCRLAYKICIHGFQDIFVNIQLYSNKAEKYKKEKEVP